MNEVIERENMIIYQIRSAARQVIESDSPADLIQNRRELNQLGADLIEIRKRNRKRE